MQTDGSFRPSALPRVLAALTEATLLRLVSSDCTHPRFQAGSETSCHETSSFRTRCTPNRPCCWRAPKAVCGSSLLFVLLPHVVSLIPTHSTFSLYVVLPNSFISFSKKSGGKGRCPSRSCCCLRRQGSACEEMAIRPIMRSLVLPNQESSCDGKVVRVRLLATVVYHRPLLQIWVGQLILQIVILGTRTLGISLLPEIDLALGIRSVSHRTVLWGEKCL